MRLGFAGTPAFAESQLIALLNAQHEIAVIYTQPDKPAGRGQHLTQSPVKQLALSKGIPVEQPVSLKTPEAQKIFEAYALDVLIVAAYGLLLPETILQAPKFGCVNVHASLLPRWRGASPIQQAILSGDVETGITLMQMDKGLDTGDILVQEKLTIGETETAGELHDRLAVLGAQLLTKSIDTLPTLTPTPQDPQKATHAAKISKTQAKIRWADSAESIERQVRAYNPWPIATFSIDGQTIRLWEAKVVPLPKAAKPGTIAGFNDHCPIVAAGDGKGLMLCQGQMPGKKMMDFPSIARGHPTLFELDRLLSYD